MKIFLIDDNELDLFIAEKMISIYSNSFKILDVQKYIESSNALEEIKNGNVPDLIFLDLNMPTMDGFKFLMALERLNIDCKIVILTSSVQDSKSVHVLENKHIIDFVTKPITSDYLKDLKKKIKF